MNKHNERRSSLRRPIHHDAVMTTQDGVALNFIIADFCLDGMFIKFMSESSKRHAVFPDIEEGCPSIELSFTGYQGKTYSINAEVVHHVQGACGLRFIQRFDPAVQSLVNLSENTGIPVDHSLPVQSILSECIQFINTTFGDLLEDFWGFLEEELRSEAVKASNDQTANAYMALAEKVKQRQSTMQKGMMRAIDDPITAFKSHLEKRKSMSDRLTMIDKHEFEDWLVSRVLVMRCEADYQDLLMPLKLRLDALGVGDKRHHQSVFGPALLVNSFHPVVQSLVVDSTAEKLIFKVFEHKVMSLLKGLYEGLNAILIRHNILPKLKIKQPKTSNIKRKTIDNKSKTGEPLGSNQEQSKPLSSPAVRSNFQSNAQEAPTALSSKVSENFNKLIETQSQAFTQPPFSSASKNASSPNSFSENQQTAQSALSNISNLLRSLRNENNADINGDSIGTDETTVYSPSEFNEGLAVLQANTSDIDWNAAPRRLIERVQDHLSDSGDEKAIDEGKKSAIDVVDRFFLSMRNNPRISSEAKQYLLKLEVPVLKVLLKDERFFEDQQSSVRAVMNRIAQLGAKGSKLNPASREKVSGLVHKIIEEFEDDTSVFDTVLDELDVLIERQNSLYVKNVERVAAAAEGTNKVEAAGMAVASAINQRIAHKFVPTAVVTLINEGWKEYLNLTFIKFGDDSEQWQEALAVIDRLIAYGDDPRMPIDIKVILPKIQEGLKLVSGNNEASLKVREALKAFILNAPNGKHLSEQAKQYSVPESEDDLFKRNVHTSQTLKDWILKVKTISLGTWLTFQKTKNDTTYMRLVWVAKGYSKFVFVNHQGRKVIELGLFKLASYFKDARIAIDSDYELPIVNQGLDDMVKDVYDKIAYQSSHDLKTGLINKVEFCRQVRLLMKKGKRTSECSLLFIRFRNSESSELTLTDGFANQVVKSLEDLSDNDMIIGRVSSIDFTIFSVVENSENYRIKAQEALIGLCQLPDNLKFNLTVVIGESRAHLGFNNPDSMIQHASEAFNNLSDSLEGNEKRQHEGDVSDLEANEELSAEKNIEPNIESNIEPKLSTQVVILDKAANADLDSQEFESLVFQLWGQSASTVNADAAVNKPVQLNLLNVIEGDSETYSPENEEESLQLDRWWVKTLIDLQQSQPHLFTDFETIRVQLSGFALNTNDITEQLISANQCGDIKASSICFDLYDCFQIQDIEISSMRMTRLKNAGYTFCLDHFGSERSPFSYLKSLPVDMIKIDDTFISALTKKAEQEESQEQIKEENQDEIAADSIVEIAHYMGKKVLAAGVDSAVCLQKMKHLKVDYVQGSTISEVTRYDV